MSAIKQKEKRAPDVVVMNSCLWDITRYVTGVKNCVFVFPSEFSFEVQFA
jgi:hypothetical protein